MYKGKDKTEYFVKFFHILLIIMCFYSIVSTKCVFLYQKNCSCLQMVDFTQNHNVICAKL